MRRRLKRAGHNPRAILTKKRNVRRGIEARSQILNLLEADESTARHLADHTEMKYSKVTYHLKLLEMENSVKKTTHKRRNVWQITGFGQQRLDRQIKLKEEKPCIFEIFRT